MTSNNMVSVLVSTFNSAGTLSDLLASVKSQTYPNLEIVVVDNNSSDASVEIARRFTSAVFSGGPERSAQRNYAASVARGDIFIVVDSDMFLTPTVVEDVVRVFNNSSVKMALVIPERSFGIGFWSACKRLERDFYLGVEWMEAARAFRRSAFVRVGGYDELNTGTEDFDLPHRVIREFGVEALGRVDAFILHNEGRLSLVKTCQKKFYYARNLDRYIACEANESAFRKQVSPFARFWLYFRDPVALIKNPIVGVGMLYLKACEMLAGFLGYCFRHRAIVNREKIYK